MFDLLSGENMAELWKVASSTFILSICCILFASIKKNSDKKNYTQESDYADYEKNFFEKLKEQNAEYDKNKKD